MTIAYLVNCYPAPSHSFIRREVLALEAAGAAIARFSLRRHSGALPDPEDQAEAERTTVVLDQPKTALIAAMFAMALRRPGSFWSALRTAVAMARRAGGRYIAHCAYLVEACWLVPRLAASGVTHVHAHFGTNPAAVARLVRRLGGPRYSFTVHGPDEFDAPLALDLPGKIADAAAVVAISAYGRSQLMRWCPPEHWARLQVVRCGLPAGYGASPTAAEARAPVGLCTVARFAPQKGLPLLIEALALLRDQGLSPKLTLVGDGELRPQLVAQVERLGLMDQVHFAGLMSADQVRATLSAHALFVLPSFAEGLPVVLMEAMALGRPVVTTYVAGIPELVDPSCGWLVPAGCAHALASALASALAVEPSVRAEMGREGARRVRQAHDSAANAALLLALFRAPPPAKLLPPSQTTPIQPTAGQAERG